MMNDGAGDDDPEPLELELDTLFELLSNRHRRRLCRFLQASGRESVSYDRLLEAIAAGDEEPLDRGRLETQLVHAHLPALADAGVITHDPRRRTVRVADASLLARCVALQSVVDDCGAVGPG